MFADTIVEFQNIYKKFTSRTALTDVSFKLPHGKIIGIIGPNGSGKSTMLKLMAGLLRPTKGKVLVEGKNVERRSSGAIAYLSESQLWCDLVAVSARLLVPLLLLSYYILSGLTIPGGRERMVDEVLNLNIWVGLLLNFIIVEWYILKRNDKKAVA